MRFRSSCCPHSRNLAASALKATAAQGGNQKLFGFVAMELARVDASISTFFGVHSGLAMGSIYPRRVGRAEEEVGTGDGTLGKDRLLRSDRTARRRPRRYRALLSAVHRPDDSLV